MRENWQTIVKKLGLAYGTGWEYMPGSGEAGSVLTDLFLEMAEENRKRFQRIWEKQELEFMKIVPGDREATKRLKTAVRVLASRENSGKWLEEGAEVCVVPKQGDLIRFRTERALQLTPAKLQYAVYRKGMCTWLSYEKKNTEKEEMVPVRLFQPAGTVIAHPLFRWNFPGLCDGKKEFCFQVECSGKVQDNSSPLPGKWTICDGSISCPAEWTQVEGKFLLRGSCEKFAENLDSQVYELKLELSEKEKMPREWLKLLRGGFVLKAEARSREPQLCLTDSGVSGGSLVFPFGRELDTAACCYVACDEVLAGEGGEIVLQFTERFEIEEKLPSPHTKEEEKIYKKYPWLWQEEPVQDWKAEETVWEYFNGSMWCILPGSEDWRTGCPGEETGRRNCRWQRPEDMKPCAMEGEEHFFIRLRLNRAAGAYASFYRKYVPVLEKIRLCAEERHIRPESCVLPEETEEGEESMYLGFDCQITPDNRWYTGETCISFAQEQIKGKKSLFGREAFWVELKQGNSAVLPCLLANYIPIVQVLEEKSPVNAGNIKISAGTLFSVESQEMGVLDAVSVQDIFCQDGADPALQEGMPACYFSRFGRLLTAGDLELLLGERYPFLRVTACSFQESMSELKIELELDSQVPAQRQYFPAEAEKQLPEICRWLEEVLSKTGELMLQNCHVACILREDGRKEEREITEDAGTDFVR